jgi:anti-sigma B factor antagonist
LDRSGRGGLKEEPVVLSFSHVDDGDILVIGVAGDLDLSTAAAFEQEIDAAVATGFREVVVDLSGVPFVDSAGINALLKGRRAADEHGRVFRVDKPSGLVQEVLAMTGVWSFLSGAP